MKYKKSNMSGMVSDYHKMYDAIKNWNESPYAGEVKDGYYIYGMGWAVSDMAFHGWVGEAAENERHHYEEVRKAHKALKVALQNALGIKQVEKEY